MIRESIFEQLARIPEDLIETHAKLENWAAWSRDRMRRGHCMSFEHRYKIPQVWDATEPRIQWDSLAAEKLHDVVCGLPERYRWIIHLHVLHRAPEGYIRRKLVIHRDELVGEVQRAMRMVRNACKSIQSVL